MEVPARPRIGEWWADRTANQLGRGAQAVRVEPKAMAVLMALAARPGEVVSREALLTAVWPGVVVGDEALTQCIIKLRRALADSPRKPAYIETIAKKGYRLIAPVGGQPAPLPAARRRWPWAVAAVIALSVGVALWHSRARPLQGVEASAALSVSVLPFEAVGPGRENDYLARGISSDLMT